MSRWGRGAGVENLNIQTNFVKFGDIHFYLIWFPYRDWLFDTIIVINEKSSNFASQISTVDNIFVIEYFPLNSMKAFYLYLSVTATL